MSTPLQSWLIEPCPTVQAEELAAALGVQRTTAEVLIRRGHGDPESARAFLDGDGAAHDPLLLGDMAAACERIEAAMAHGERVCVHGDYDADGICATALAVLILGDLGARVEWHLPSRFDEGYGLATDTVERLAADGVALLITVDCGITAVEPVARARQLGMDVIVTDHHRPADTLPDAPLVCTRPSSYPFPELCGSGVVYKLGQALHRRAGRPESDLEQHLDLVALATIADVVPLLDENRALVRAGLRRLARTARPGLRALMHSSRVDRVNVSSGDVGFRLGPRINAAGRLCHPAEALELLLTTDDRRATALAQRLESLNRERQAVERGILNEAVEQIDGAPQEWRERCAYVLSSPDWHEGVIGIVASRLAERYRRPVVLIAELGDEAKGSGRSGGGYDLHAGLHACAAHLLRFGGHRAAAGLTIAAGEIEVFGRALAEHAAQVVGPESLQPRTRVDAVVCPAEATLDLADELRRLEPFGLGNPAVTLLAPAAVLRDPARIGQGRHLRCAVELNGCRCGAVGFGLGELAAELDGRGRHDVAFRLERNAYNGSVAPRMVLRGVVPAAGRGAVAWPRSVPATAAPTRAGIRDRRRMGLAVGTLVRLLAAGESVLLVTADAEQRGRSLGRALDPVRLFADAAAGRLAVTDHETLTARGAGDPADHVLVLDPPTDAHQAAAIAALGQTTTVHRVWGRAEIAFALAVAEAREPLRDTLAAVWRARRSGVAELPAGLSATTVEGCLEVLAEVGLDDGAAAAGAAVDLNRSARYRAAVERAEQVRAFLGQAELESVA